MKYFNKMLYTDVESWKVLSINRHAKTCLVQPCRRIPKDLEFAEDGTCLNNHSAYIGSDIECFGEKILLEYRKGKWGRWMWCGWTAKIDEVDWDVANSPEYREKYFVCVNKDTGIVQFQEKTKGGKPKKGWSVFCGGKMSNHCNYFYDYNF